MIDTPRILTTAAELTAIVHITIPRSEIRTVVGPGIGEVMAALKAQGIAPAGPMFSHHLKMQPDIFDFELGVPVTQAVVPTGRVKPGRLPATTVARTIYHGAYDDLGAGWGELMQWIATNGHTAAPDLWESYVTGPESNPDPTAWRTELNRRLIGYPGEHVIEAK
jgi:effector-binding domain-containing protein